MLAVRLPRFKNIDQTLVSNFLPVIWYDTILGALVLWGYWINIGVSELIRVRNMRMVVVISALVPLHLRAVLASLGCYVYPVGVVIRHHDLSTLLIITLHNVCAIHGDIISLRPFSTMRGGQLLQLCPVDCLWSFNQLPSCVSFFH